MHIVSKLKSWNLENQRVLVRADVNVPLTDDGKIISDLRLQALLPTIDYIQQQGGTVIIMTHIGRPDKPTAALSTKNLIPWFEKKGYTVQWADNLDDTYTKTRQLNASTILLLENLRFFPGEKAGDAAFAQQLARLGDYYVNDAFGTLHRADASITLVPTYFDANKKTVGLLVEKELAVLNQLINKPKQPFVLVIGGGKVADKLPLLEKLLDKVTTILLCPAIVFTFLKAQHIPVGKSLVDMHAVSLCKELMTKAQQQGVTIVFPLDYQVATDTINGALSIVDADNIPDNALGISIGPKTITLFSSILAHAQTIFFNAAMGFAQRPETVQGACALLQAAAKSPGFVVVGGGDSTALAQKINLGSNVHLCTGGGATLTYLSGQPLPGLVALE